MSCLDLARSQGKTLSIPLTPDEVKLFESQKLSSHSKNMKGQGQPFDYLIVIDFESTCWTEKNRNGRSNEIIEFPAVLMNTSSGAIEDEFHHYVLPQENPTLSAFCTQLTGISQETVENGTPLKFILQKFHRWILKLTKERQLRLHPDTGGASCAFVTWSDWDLGVMLQNESSRKELHTSSSLDTWIDLRHTYRTFYNRKPQGLMGALTDLGMVFYGQQHSGICDARNTARLAFQMTLDGCVLNITRTKEKTLELLNRKKAFKRARVMTAPQSPPPPKKPLLGSTTQSSAVNRSSSASSAVNRSSGNNSLFGNTASVVRSFAKVKPNSSISAKCADDAGTASPSIIDGSFEVVSEKSSGSYNKNLNSKKSTSSSLVAGVRSEQDGGSRSFSLTLDSPMLCSSRRSSLMNSTGSSKHTPGLDVISGSVDFIKSKVLQFSTQKEKPINLTEVSERSKHQKGSGAEVGESLKRQKESGAEVSESLKHQTESDAADLLSKSSVDFLETSCDAIDAPSESLHAKVASPSNQRSKGHSEVFEYSSWSFVGNSSVLNDCTGLKKVDSADSEEPGEAIEPQNEGPQGRNEGACDVNKMATGISQNGAGDEKISIGNTVPASLVDIGKSAKVRSKNQNGRANDVHQITDEDDVIYIHDDSSDTEMGTKTEVVQQQNGSAAGWDSFSFNGTF